MRPCPPRRGAAAVEFAIVGPLALFLLLSVIICGLGVFRYQQVAHLAREGSRWASTHGTQYEKDTGNPAASASAVFDQAIGPLVAGLDADQLTCTVAWDADNRPYHTRVVNGDVTAVTNTVTVTVAYYWLPEAFFGGMTLSSSSVCPMAN